MTEIDGSIASVRRLVELVAEYGLAKVEVEVNGQQIMIKGLSAPASPAAGAEAEEHVAVYSAPKPQSKKPVPPAPSNRIVLESPMVGVFYRAATPEDPAFVEVGDVVKQGQPIGLIEAMKVYSEVPADHAGRIVEIVATNGVLVQQGEPLMYLEPL